MRLPTIASMTPFAAWTLGLALAAVLVVLPFIAVLVPLPMPFAASFYGIPVGVAVLAVYALTVHPRLFAASGVLLGIAAFLALGVIDGLARCAQFNRGGPSGGCEADPTSQVVLTVAVYLAALVVTGAALVSMRRAA